MAKVSMKQLDELHKALVETLTKAVSKTWYDEETGEEIPPPAAFLNVARQLLKDNGVQAEITKGSPLAFLQSSVLPFEDLKDALDEKARH